jgi:signal transduction histidine kinase
MSVAADAPRKRRLAPRRWLVLPARTARLRLTLLYAGLFFVLGSGMLALVFLVSTHSSSVSISARPTPFGRFVGPGPFGLVGAQQDRDKEALLAASWLGLGLTTVAAGVLGWFAAGRVLRPVRTITNTARTISAGNLHERLALTGPDDEFKRLGDTLDELLERLETSFEAQRRFVANASHELRTPLTLERTLLQVALADPNATAEQLRSTCGELLAAGGEQERLLESLLTLASSERGLDRREPLDLASIAGSALLAPRPEIERLSLTIERELSPASTVGDPALVERLVANLVDNAVRHNNPGGWAKVGTTVAGGRALLAVTNSGPAIPPDDVERLFEPFQRFGADRAASDQHGHGLGLSIVRAIATAHGASVVARAQPDGGLAVSVSFPA